MSVAYSIIGEKARLAELIRELDGIRDGVPRAVSRAINKVGVSARTRIVRGICEAVTLKASEVRQRNVTLTKAGYDRLEAMLSISGRRIPLLRWGARQTKKGVSYSIRRGGRTVIPGAFMESHGRRVRMPNSGHEGVFQRVAGAEHVETLKRMLLTAGEGSALKALTHRWDREYRGPLEGQQFNPWGYKDYQTTGSFEMPVGGYVPYTAAEKREQQARRAGIIARIEARLEKAKAVAAALPSGGRVGRLPIGELRGPSVVEVVRGIAELAEDTFQRAIDEQLQREIETQAELVLGGPAGPAAGGRAGQ